MDVEEIKRKIKEIEEEILRTQKNKATEHHLGKLKAKLARLKDAEKEEVTQLRELQVRRKVGLEQQGVELDIQTKQKQREIQVQELEKKRTEVEAETHRRKVEIEATAEKYRRLATEVDVEAERIKRMAEAKRFELESRAKGEAAMILEAKKAEAEGILKRIQALSKADSRFFQEMIINKLPEIYQNLEVDRMIITGSKEDAFATIANSIMPFLQIIPELAKKTSEDSK